jgi:hypothetical protein
MEPRGGRVDTVPMREECKHFQSRTYASGEVARFCVLDLAPEAPWRCPDDCPRYDRRYADVGWQHGSLIEPTLEDEPHVDGAEISSLLDAAEDIVNAVVSETRDDVERARRRGRGYFSRLFRRNRPGGGRS